MSELIVVGDKVLIEPLDGEQKTDAGILLPATVAEKEKVQGGRVVKVGPGYLIANPEYSSDRPWSNPGESVRYLPLQAQAGDFAYFLKGEGTEFNFKGTAYQIVSHRSILALVRPDAEALVDNLKDILG